MPKLLLKLSPSAIPLAQTSHQPTVSGHLKDKTLDPETSAGLSKRRRWFPNVIILTSVNM